MSKTTKINMIDLRKEFGIDKINTKDDVIVYFLNKNNDPQEFGEINNFLKKHNLEYGKENKNARTGLAHTLLRLIKLKKIKKLRADKNHIYPRYTSNSKINFESALDGYLFRNETIGSMFRNIGIDFDSEFDPKNMDFFVKPENKIKALVNYLGVQMLDTILSSYVRPINSKESTKSNKKNRDIWLKNALAYHEPDIGIIDMFERVMTESNDNELFENKSWLKDVNLLKKSLRKTYPNITKYIDDYEDYSEELRDAMRDTYLTNKRLSPKIID